MVLSAEKAANVDIVLDGIDLMVFGGHAVKLGRTRQATSKEADLEIFQLLDLRSTANWENPTSDSESWSRKLSAYPLRTNQLRRDARAQSHFPQP